MADSSASGGPVCIKCKATSSLLWQKNQSGTLLCSDCHSQERRTRSSRSPQRIASSTMNASSSENSSTSSSSYSSTTTITSTTTTTTSSSSTNNPQAQSGEKPSSNKYQTSTINTRRTTRARERNNRAKQQQQQQQQQQQLQQQQQQVQQVQTLGSASGSTPPSPATSTNGASVKEKANSKPPLSNGTHDRDNVNGEEDPQKGTGRRSLKLKQGCRQPTKAPSPEPMIITSDSIIHKGNAYEVGDIVSLMDRDGGIYYAMIRGFMQDQYAEKYAVLTWLLPRYPNPTHFDPANFILGPEEDIPRSMEVIDFVSHSPQSRHFQTSYFHNLEQAELWKH